MKTHFLKGTKQEIVERLAQISGEVREAIVFEEEESAMPRSVADKTADVFAEMRPLMVDAQDVDDSRETIYTEKPRGRSWMIGHLLAQLPIVNDGPTTPVAEGH